MTDLKPCPFCGGNDLSLSDNKKFIECNNCFAEGPLESSSIHNWNSLPSPETGEEWEKSFDNMAGAEIMFGSWTDATKLKWKNYIRSILASQENKVEELETVLGAWYLAFGTSQLTHAKGRLEAAEEKAERQAKQGLGEFTTRKPGQKELNDAKEVINDLIECGGFRLGSKLDVKECLLTIKRVLSDGILRVLEEDNVLAYLSTVRKIGFKEIHIVRAICQHFGTREISEKKE